MKSRILRFGLLVLVTAFSGGTGRSATMSFRNVPGGAISISGRATLGSWSCRTSQFNAVVIPGLSIEGVWREVSLAEHKPDFSTADIAKEADIDKPRAYVTIPVASLQCGSAPMRADLFRALKAKQSPFIVFVLEDVQQVTVVRKEGDAKPHFDFSVTGSLVLAGVDRPVQIHGDVVQTSDSRFELKAEKRLKMSDFGITPPTALFGLIKASDEVVISADVVFDLKAREVPLTTAGGEP